MNLRQSKGKVAIRGRGETPYLMVNFPDREMFDKLFSRVHGDNREKYWNILKNRSLGMTLADAGKPYNLCRERVRQIEAKFIRLVGDAYWIAMDANIRLMQHFSQNTFSMLEMHETVQHEGGSH
jgi:hypothetical protein